VLAVVVGVRDRAGPGAEEHRHRPAVLQARAGQLLHPHVIRVVEQPAQLAGHRAGVALADGTELVHDLAPSILLVDLDLRSGTSAD
jgi:hypothetical protein